MADNCTKHYTIEQAKKAVMNKWHWDSPEDNFSIFIWGPIGIGKTQIVHQMVIERIISELKVKHSNNTISKEEVLKLERLLSCTIEKVVYFTDDKGILRSSVVKATNTKPVSDIIDEHLLTLRLAERPIEQLQGIPAPDFDKRRAVFLMPENVQAFSEKDWVVVFVDELDKADESKMTAATHLIEARRIGDFTFPRDTMIIIGANRVEDSFISKPIVPELRNRGAHIEISPDVPTWIRWAKANNIRNDIVRYHEYQHKIKEQKLAVYDEAESDDLHAFRTPRSWHCASMQMNFVEKNGGTKDEVIDELRQFVGSKGALEFDTYYELYVKVDLMKILRGEEKVPSNKDMPAGSDYNKIVSDQYIYSYAMCDQLEPEHLDNDLYLMNLANAMRSFHTDICLVFFENILARNNLFDKLCSSNHTSDIVGMFIDKIKLLSRKE